MANYKLSYMDNKEYKEIIWNKGIYSGYNNHLLKDIDTFTMLFPDTLSLKRELIKIDALDSADITKKIGIRYLSKGKMKLIPYEIAFRNDRFFFEINGIKQYLKTAKNDYELIDKLCAHYRNSYVNNFNVARLHNYLEKIYSNQVTNDDIINYEKIIDDFVNREVYKYDYKTQEYEKDKDGNVKVMYKNLHDLAIFLAYDYKKRKEPDVYLLQHPTIEQPKVKKKNDQIIGQYSLFE